jgi:hypothetical protein
MKLEEQSCRGSQERKKTCVPILRSTRLASMTEAVAGGYPVASNVVQCRLQLAARCFESSGRDPRPLPPLPLWGVP